MEALVTKYIELRDAKATLEGSDLEFGFLDGAFGPSGFCGHTASFRIAPG